MPLLPVQLGRMLDSVYRPLGLGAMLALQAGALLRLHRCARVLLSRGRGRVAGAHACFACRGLSTGVGAPGSSMTVLLT